MVSVATHQPGRPDRRSTAYELSKGCDCGFVSGAIAGQQCGVGETERAEIGGGQRDDDSVLGAELVVLVLDSLWPPRRRNAPLAPATRR